ncbi:MAG TPA: cytochrome P450 [Bacillales bacterium]|nr:cytochrome P450 [Bacillales bacterium]
MSNTNQMPREKGMDHTLSLAREGYMYIPNRRHSFHSDIFETRLLGKKAICMGGKEAAELFYDNDKFKRNGAAPKRVVKSFFGKNSVQTLDGDAHKHRKEMLMSVMSLEGLEKLTDVTKEQWEKAVDHWAKMDQVVLYEEVQILMCRIACQWAGVPLQESEVNDRAKDLAAMFESVATVGPAYWAGRHARNDVDKWIEGLVDEVRNGEIHPPEDTVLYRFSWHRDLEGNLLDPKTVAVEVINILRPTVAISIFINFLTLAVYHYPEEKEKVASGGEKEAEMFVQEVRRYYPFFPLLTALVKKDFTWKDYDFEEGTLTLLDLYGTNHDPDIWDNPDVFNPGRFDDWEGSPFGFIPQGGGDYWLGHRCAGEWVTVEIMKVSLDYLVNRMDYEVPNQDLSFSMVSLPSIPHSKVIIEKVRRNS